jgi:hypothetical protein
MSWAAAWTSCRSAGLLKPPAQPTQVRTLHLPLPAKTAPGLRLPRPAGRLLVVAPWCMMCRRGASCRSGCGHGLAVVGMAPAATGAAGVLLPVAGIRDRRDAGQHPRIAHPRRCAPERPAMGQQTTAERGPQGNQLTALQADHSAQIAEYARCRRSAETAASSTHMVQSWVLVTERGVDGAPGAGTQVIAAGCTARHKLPADLALQGRRLGDRGTAQVSAERGDFRLPRPYRAIL